MKYIFIVYLLLFSLTLSAAVKDGDLIMVYGDGSNAAIFRQLEKELKEELKERKIKIDEKGKKGYLLKDLVANIEKEVLKKNPAVIILTSSVSDFYDAKKKEPLSNIDQEALFAQLKSLAETINSKGIELVLATPSLAGEHILGANAIDKILDEWSERIRGLCQDLDVVCCDLRKDASAYLKTENTTGKIKGLLTKDGIKISKEGAVVLLPALLKALGMMKDGIGAPLTATDHVKFFLQSNYAFGRMENRIDALFKSKFPEATGPVKPIFKRVPIPSVMKNKESAKLISAHKARVSFMYFFDDITSENKYPLFEECSTQLYAEVKDSVIGKVYVFTLPSQNEKTDDALHSLRKRINEHIRKCAIDNGFGIVDMYALSEAEMKANPAFKVKTVSGGSTAISKPYAALLEKEVIRILGLAQQ